MYVIQDINGTGNQTQHQPRGRPRRPPPTRTTTIITRIIRRVRRLKPRQGRNRFYLLSSSKRTLQTLRESVCVCGGGAGRETVYMSGVLIDLVIFFIYF